MTADFIVSVNSEKVLEYYRDRKLSDKQNNDLSKLEVKLSSSINVDGKKIDNPSSEDKAIFVATSLAEALLKENEAIAALCCSYLATRYPSMKHLKIVTKESHLSIEAIYDKEFKEQTPIKFVAKSDLV